MLLPHKPSQHLHKPLRLKVGAEDLADVHITVVPATTPDNTPTARAVPSGRTAALNPRPVQ